MCSTLALLAATIGLACLPIAWPWRLLSSIVAGGLLVRTFIVYHDYAHGAILAKSRLAKTVMTGIGWAMLTPLKSWRRSHNHHHAHVGKLSETSTGAFPMMTLSDWADTSSSDRLFYRIARHPLTLLFAYLTVFLMNITVMPLIREPRKHLDSVFSILTHLAIIGVAWWLGGTATMLFAVVIPFAIASAMGAYLFYVQHSFDGIHIHAEDEWERGVAAVDSSSYLKTGRLMAWFTGNIGYHHIHHADHRIPFYRSATSHARGSRAGTQIDRDPRSSQHP